jgi:uncharacterized membrane protein YeaQ/YmgE (transglycosylase-associated protein family)
MNIIIWPMAGGVIGWVASRSEPDAQRGIVLNVGTGIVGAALGGWALSSIVGVWTVNQNNFSGPGLLVSLLGAAILLSIVSLMWRDAVR